MPAESSGKSPSGITSCDVNVCEMYPHTSLEKLSFNYINLTLTDCSIEFVSMPNGNC